MKQFFSLLLISFLATAVQADDTVVAYVKNVSGNATVENAGVAVQARPGTPIRMGNILRTGERSSLGVTFKDNTLMSFGSGSQTTVDEYLYAPGKSESRLIASMARGTLEYVSGIIAKLKPEAVAVRTPTGTIGIRGTHFLAKVDTATMQPTKQPDSPPVAQRPATTPAEFPEIPSDTNYLIIWWARAEAELSGATRAPRPVAVATAPAMPKPLDSYVVLGKNPDGSAGRISFTDKSNRSVEIGQPGFGVMMEAGNKGAFGIDQKKLAADFTEAMLALPKLPVTLLLHYQTGGTQLTKESEARIQEILKEVGLRQVPDVSIIGHTDTVGTPERNDALGLRRAQSVAAVIKTAGLSVQDVTIASHGENNLLVKTPTNTPEPRNRRVEVTVR